MQQRVSGDGTGVHEQRRQMRVVQHRVLSERYRVCEKGLHVLQRNRRRGDRLPNAQYRQVRVVHRKQVLDQRRVPSVDHVLRCAVRVDVSDQHAKPCLRNKGLHVLRRNWRHRDRLPNAQYRQVCVVRRRLLTERWRCVHFEYMHVLRRNWRDGNSVPNAQYRALRVVLVCTLQGWRLLHRMCGGNVPRVSYFFRPIMRYKRVHVLGRHWIHGHRMPQQWRHELRVVPERTLLIQGDSFVRALCSRPLLARGEYNKRHLQNLRRREEIRKCDKRVLGLRSWAVPPYRESRRQLQNLQSRQVLARCVRRNL